MEALAVDVAHGRVRGVLLRDQITGRDERVDATWVINCSGPWADRICQRSSIRMPETNAGRRARLAHCPAALSRFAEHGCFTPKHSMDAPSLFCRGMIRSWWEQPKLPTAAIPAEPLLPSDPTNQLPRALAGATVSQGEDFCAKREARLCRNPAAALLARQSSLGGHAAAHSARSR
jgi:hypothetical protein